MACKTCKRALHTEHEDKDGNCCFCAPENFNPKGDVKKSWKSDSAPPKPKRKPKDDE